MSGIVVAYVASPEGESAVRQGIAEAQERQCPLLVVYSDHRTQVDSSVAMEHAAQLERIQELLSAADVEAELRHLVEGSDPANDVLSAADEIDADLIVLGIRRRSPVGKLVLGSHAQTILLEATVPVLAVKA